MAAAWAANLDGGLTGRFLLVLLGSPLFSDFLPSSLSTSNSSSPPKSSSDVSSCFESEVGLVSDVSLTISLGCGISLGVSSATIVLVSLTTLGSTRSGFEKASYSN